MAVPGLATGAQLGLEVSQRDQGEQAFQSLPAQLGLLRRLCIAHPRCWRTPLVIGVPWHPKCTCLQQGLQGSQVPELLEQGTLPQGSCIHWRGIQQWVKGRHHAPHESLILRVGLEGDRGGTTRTAPWWVQWIPHPGASLPIQGQGSPSWVLLCQVHVPDGTWASFWEN